MNKHLQLIIAALSIIICFVYIGNVEPRIDNPVVLGAFFLLVLNAMFWALYCTLMPLKMGRATYIVAFVLALGLLYLMALSTLNSLGILDVLVVTVAEALVVAFIIGPFRRSRR